tara:strand:+ start:13856 stop:15871 length:2016 start_codon:yes stop_codon:yes gene_type:complete
MSANNSKRILRNYNKYLIYFFNQNCFRFYKSLNNSKRNFILLLIDSLNIIFSLYLVYYLVVTNNEEIKDFFLFQFKYYPIIVIFGLILYYLTGQYRTILRYLRIIDLYFIGLRNFLLISITFFAGSFFSNKSPGLNIFIIFILTFAFVNIVSKFTLKELINFFNKYSNNKIYKVGIFGAGEAGAQLASSLLLAGNYKIFAFFDDSPNLWKRKLLGIPILPRKKISNFKGKIDQVLFAIPSLDESESNILIKQIDSYKIPILRVPSIENLTSGIEKIDSLRPIEIEDLLGRGTVKPSKQLMEKSILNKNICITGAGGSIGKELCKQILEFNPRVVLFIEASEPALYHLEQDLLGKLHKKQNIKVISKLANINNLNLLIELFTKYEIGTVFHAAAYKHVPMIEKNPLEGILNNTFSSYNICKAAELTKVNDITLISTDKAVRPSNVMGASKRLAEIIFQAFASKEGNKDIFDNKSSILRKFSIVRFGNVLGSSGSVVPLFKKQIKSGGPITLTDKNVVRYFMTIKEAAQLVIQSNAISQGGDIFLLDMGEPVKIADLAKLMVRLSGLSIKDSTNPTGDIEIITTGLRPGEKMYEELLIDGKARRTTHPLIYRADEKFISFEKLIKKLDQLKICIDNFEVNKSLEILHELVPEWQRNINLKNKKFLNKNRFEEF